MAGNFRDSGYLASAFDGIATAALNSIADGSLAVGAEIDNSSNLYTLVDIALSLASAAFVASSYAKIFLIRSIDGSAYPPFTAGASPKLAEGDYLVGSIFFHAETIAQLQHLYDVPLPPGKYKVGVINKCGVTWAASGNTLTLRPHAPAYT
jgi:hypothetical protein